MTRTALSKERNWIAVVITILACLCVAYLLILIIAFFVQDKIVFPAGKSVWRTPKDYDWDFEEIQLSVQGETTFGWFVPHENARATVLFSHGNGGTMADRLDVAMMFHDLGCNVLLYDYGGYGRSTGKPSEKRCYADVRAMWDYLVHTKSIPPRQIIAFGESLGGGVAVELAAEQPVGGLILMATFLSAVKVGQHAFPFLPVGLFLRHKFDSEHKIGNVRSPVLIFHSPSDETIPFEQGKTLFQLANEPKQFVSIRGGHNDGFFESRKEITESVASFLETYFPTPQPR
jgi:fermentation-respiration switch protein FrsA (DUF1100 family)